MNKFFLVLLAMLCLGSTMHATHIVGGDLSYVYLGNNTYQFTFNIYRDCLPPSQGGGSPAALQQDNPVYFSFFQGSSFYDIDSFSYSSVILVPVNFSNDCINNPPNTCISRMQFIFNKVLPPSNIGYTVLTQRCCRNETLNNINNPGTTGATYYCKIPPVPYHVNNSAAFINYPPQVICVNNPFNYDHSAFDPDGDSLSYSFCDALVGGDPQDPKPFNTSFPGLFSVSYKSPFSSSLPMSGLPPLTIDPQTGIITGTPNMQGRFVVTVCCTEWRNGVSINTVTREFQFVVANCSKAVVANIPVLSQEPNTYVVQCKSFTVNFENWSSGGFKYDWDFGVPSLTTDTSSLFEPSYTYPDTGTYKVTLWVNKGSTCPDSIVRLVKVYPTFKTDFTYSGLLCPEIPISFTDQSTSQYGTINYWNWSFGDGAVSSIQNVQHYYPNLQKTYNVTLVSGNNLGCRDTMVKPLTVPAVNIFAGNDTTIVQGESIYFNATGGVSYVWNPPLYLNTTLGANPIGVYPDTGRFTYIVQGTTVGGCVQYDTITITVADDAYLLMPNVFSPNGDGLNDEFHVLFAGFRKLNYFKIFNRFGELVFSSNDLRKGWDGYYKGRLCDLGTYYWMVSAIDLSYKPRFYKGDITVVY